MRLVLIEVVEEKRNTYTGAVHRHVKPLELGLDFFKGSSDLQF